MRSRRLLASLLSFKKNFLNDKPASWGIIGFSLWRRGRETDSDGSTTEKNVFLLDETPFLYAKLPQVESGDLTSLFTNWKSGEVSV